MKRIRAGLPRRTRLRAQPIARPARRRANSILRWRAHPLARLAAHPAVRRAAALALLAAFLGALDGFWVEPRRLLLRREARLEIGDPGRSSGSGSSLEKPLRIVHLSDLHVSRETALLRKLVAAVAAERPDLVVISGDLVRDTPRQGPLSRHTAALAALVSELRRTAPVYAVQGHSEHQGRVVAALADAGITWLSNEGTRVGPGGEALLLGVNQQVGHDALVGSWPSPFRPQRRRWGWAHGAVTGEAYRNAYDHYDPSPMPGGDLAGMTGPAAGPDGPDGLAGLARLAEDGGPFAWSGYDLFCDVLVEDEETAVGVTAHSRFVLGEDRMIRLIRDNPDDKVAGDPEGFFLTAQGTLLTGDLETGVDPEPGRWYRLRLRTEVSPGRVRVLAKVWPARSAEPRAWQARADDRSRHRLTAGTVGLWAAGGGTALYRNLRVVGRNGRVLLDRPLAGREEPAGFRKGTRGTRLAMALARSPAVPPGTPRIVLSHSPDVALEAAWRGLDAVLAGHTHGGQVRLPFLGALTTRSRLGNYYDQGLFALAAPNPRGWSWLYIQPGIGTSLLPVRFWCPPSWTALELRAGGGDRGTVPR